MSTTDHRIDIARERVIALADAPRILPHRRGGKPVAVATLHRWSRKGLGGIRLETIQCAGTRCTSVEALQRFFDRLTVARQGGPTHPATPTGSVRDRVERLQRRLRQAEALLDANNTQGAR
jgi:hypothetical protein